MPRRSVPAFVFPQLLFVLVKTARPGSRGAGEIADVLVVHGVVLAGFALGAVTLRRSS